MTPVQVAKEQLLLEGELKPFHSVVLRLPVTDETHIAPALDRVAEVLGNQVSTGSYPVSPCSTPCQCSPVLLCCLCKNMQLPSR
jgi:hypothetical protein